MRQFAEAEQLAAEVLKASRTDAAAVSILARALMAQGRGEAAIAPLQRTARRAGDPPSKPCSAWHWEAPDAAAGRSTSCA